MYVGVGALSEQQKADIKALLPRFWSREFEECWVDETNMKYRHCAELNAIHDQLSEEDAEEMDDFVSDSVPTLSSRQLYTYAALVAAGGFALGMLAAVAMR